MRTPITLITGPLGSGKTTLLRYILSVVPGRLAILMNEFGEIAIDSKVVEGKNVRIAELGGGCVCCSLQGEFEAAVEEIVNNVDPDRMIVETTGVAEPEALIFDIQESLPRVRLDGVVTVADADGMIRFPQLGHTTRMQIEDADAVLLNKSDLVSHPDLDLVEGKIRLLNPQAAILRATMCRVDPELIFGIAQGKDVHRPEHTHQPEFESFSYRTDSLFNKKCFEEMLNRLPQAVYRAKGFVRFPEGPHLFNFVAGRWELEPFPEQAGALVFIGKGIKPLEAAIRGALKECEG